MLPQAWCWLWQADLRAQAEARDDYKRSVQANEQEQRRKAERKQKEQEENAAILQQAIALRVKQDQVGDPCLPVLQHRPQHRPTGFLQCS